MIKIAFSGVYCYTLYHCLGLFLSLPRYIYLLFHCLPSSVSFLGWVYFFHIHCLPRSVYFHAWVYFFTVSLADWLSFFPCLALFPYYFSTCLGPFFPCGKMKNSRENQKKNWGYIYCMYCEVLLSGSISGSSAYTPKSEEKQDKDNYTCQGPSHGLLEVWSHGQFLEMVKKQKL